MKIFAKLLSEFAIQFGNSSTGYFVKPIINLVTCRFITATDMGT